jgi:hypothetical protein
VACCPNLPFLKHIQPPTSPSNLSDYPLPPGSSSTPYQKKKITSRLSCCQKILNILSESIIIRILSSSDSDYLAIESFQSLAIHRYAFAQLFTSISYMPFHVHNRPFRVVPLLKLNSSFHNVFFLHSPQNSLSDQSLDKPTNYNA